MADREITSDDIKKAILAGYPIGENESPKDICDRLGLPYSNIIGEGQDSYRPGPEVTLSREMVDQVRQALRLALASCKSEQIRVTIGKVLSDLEREAL
jgi:hypothetical protein